LHQKYFDLHYNKKKELLSYEEHADVIRPEIRVNYLTVPIALRELEKIEMVHRNNGQYRLDHAISKRQKTILSAFGMNDTDIRKLTSEIGILPANNQSLTSMETDDGEEVVYDDDEIALDIFD